MAYPDAQFNSRYTVPCVGLTTASLTGTGTAVATGGALTATAFPVFVRRSAVRNVTIVVVTAPVAAVTGELINFTNGTNTFATATIGTLTAGQVVSVAGNANSTFADLGQPAGTVIGTLTSTATGAGLFNIWFDVQELYE